MSSDVLLSQFCKRANHPGISLVEVLLMVALLGFMTLPMVLMLQSVNSTDSGVTLYSGRNAILSRITDELDPENPQFGTAYVDATVQPLVISGQTIGYMRKPDAANSDALNRRLYVYLYKKQTDAATAYYYKMTRDYSLDEIRLDVGQTTTGFTDNSNQVWGQDVAYSATDKTPGYTAGTAGTGAVTPTNVVTENQALYTTFREGNPVSYSFDVPNGSYTVQLYFAELDSTINGSANRRLADIQIETVTKLSSYSPFESKGYRVADIKSFDVDVSDGVLNVSLVKSATSNQNPRLAAIVVRPHV